MTATYLGRATNPANTDLDLLAQTAANANSTATTALATANTALADALLALATIPVPILGRTITTLQSWVNGMGKNFLNAADYGVVGNGVADDTAALQAALNDGATYKCAVYCGRMVVKVTGALTMSGPGLWFDSCSYGNAGDPGILASGSGYVVLTVTQGSPQTAMQFCIYGTANAVNGLYRNNPFLGNWGKIRVYNILGYGIKTDKCWDCVFQSDSVELCVDNAQYSYQWNDAGDTCNMSTVLQWQVERCGNRAISISGSTLCCSFGPCHSEQITPSAGVVTWLMGSSRSNYHVGRFECSSNPANATLKIAGGDSKYSTFLVEGAIDVSVDAGSAASVCVLENFEVQGTLHMLNGQAGTAVLIGGQITSIYDPTLATGTTVPALKCFGTYIASLSLGFQTNFDPTLAQFYACTIPVLASTSTHASAIFRDCLIGTTGASLGNLLGGNQFYYGCTLLGNGTITYSSGGTLTMSDCACNMAISVQSGTAGAYFRWSTFSSTFAVPNADTTCFIWGCTITGNYSANANPSVIIDEQTTVLGTVTNGGVPNSGANKKGYTHWTPAPASGAAPGWRCTASANPGTWKAMANLA